MKKLLFILTVLILQACHQTVDDRLIVQTVQESRNQERKYRYELKENNKCACTVKLIFYSNKRYNIGDTLIK